MSNLNEVINNQAEIGNGLCKLYENFKKEPKDRLEKKDRVLYFAEKANEFIYEFRAKHQVLLASYEELKLKKYFDKNYNGYVEETYTKLKEKLTIALEPFQLPFPEIKKVEEKSDVNIKDKQTDKNEFEIDTENAAKHDDNDIEISDDSEIEEKSHTIITKSNLFTSTPKLNRVKHDALQQGAAMQVNNFTKRIKIFENEIDRMENCIMMGNHTRVKSAKPFMESNYQRLQEEMNAICEVIGNHDIGECEFRLGKLQDRFFDLLGEIGGHKMNRRAEVANIEPISLKLKPIQIPSFSGDFKEWPTFSELFTSLIIENNVLSNVQRMQYLKTNVSADAAKVIAKLEITNDNFELAWDLLKNRFNNRRAIFNIHLDTLMNQPNITSESAYHLKKFHDVSRECSGLLKKVSAEQIIVFILTKKLDKDTHKLYEQSLSDPKEEQKLSDFLDFIEKRYQVLEAVQGDTKRYRHENRFENRNENRFENKYDHKYENKYDRKHESFEKKQEGNGKCVCCSENHALYKCLKFKKMKVADRRELVHQHKLCILCLQGNHKAINCFLKKNCSKCGRKHNDLLHYEEGEMKPFPKHQSEHKKVMTTFVTSEQMDDDNENEMRNNCNISLYFSDCKNGTILATAVIRIKEKHGWSDPVCALIDGGATACCVAESLVKRGQFGIQKGYFNITGLGGVFLAKSRGTVELDITARFETPVVIGLTAIVVNKMSDLVTQSEEFDKNIMQLPEISDLVLADPTCNRQSKIELLLGADVFYDIIEEGLIKPLNTGLLLQSTEFGWIISGSVNKRSRKTTKESCFNINVKTSVENLIKNFFDNESIQDNEEELSSNEEYCIEHFNKTVARDENGRYEVSLPFKRDRKMLGNSRRSAVAQFFQLERKFKANSTYKQLYVQFIKEYLEMGHMKLNTVKYLDSECYYLPHHAVFKSSTTTKLRTVFDGSRKTSTGVSLNDELEKGPRVQDFMINIMMRFRLHRIAFTADIAKMYRQIKLNTEQQQYQLILWRENENEELKEYKLTTVTYGTTPAPFMATQVLAHHAECNQTKFPEACEKIKNDMYMDDVTSGCDDIDTAVKLQREITSLLADAGMPLRKWSTNDKEFFHKIPREHREGALIELEEGKDNSVTSLGLRWYCDSDTLGFIVQQPAKKPITKRQIYSEISKIYDPMGLIAPVIVANKILMQQIWVEGTDWNEAVSEEIIQKWDKFSAELGLLSELKMDRWIKFRPGDKAELHGFADASEKAYGAVIYAKIISNNKIFVTLLTAKTRIAPITKITLPKLELNAAHLLAKLMTTTKNALKIEIKATKYYSDSEITLAWIKSSADRWKPYIARRVRDIQNQSNSNDWSHVQTKMNPADHASRGLSPKQLINNELWWNGPVWLRENDFTNAQLIRFNTTLEEKKDKRLNVMQVSVSTDIVERFSSLNRAMRVIAICLRYMTNLRRSAKLKSAKSTNTVDKNELSSFFVENDELFVAKNTIVRLCQQKYFAIEYELLRKGQQVNKDSKLKTLCPFIDGNGVLRVGGRLQNSNLNYNRKHPIIVPYTSNLTKMIIRDAHMRTLHGGNQLTLSQTRHEFWIVGAKRAVKTFINRCVACYRFSAAATTQLMGSLPSVRTKRMVRPFTNCGTDLCGPIFVRVSGERGVRSSKGYIVIFICLSTKAVHLEVVSDMTSEAFIAALKRMIGRRGNVGVIYSDNGTNFVGAKSILEIDGEDAKKQFRDDIKNYLAIHNTKFVFNPPAAPWMGGIWERNIRSLKTHLRKVVLDRKLTYEGYSTVLIQIEAVLNSRPLCPLSENPAEMEALTPGHFLIGEALTAPMEPNLTNVRENRLDKWDLYTKIKQEFWQRWSDDYMALLQPRTKWTDRKENLKVGDMVLVRDELMPPLRWPLGRIDAVYPGKDGLVRVVDVKFNSKIYKRPIGKLSLLPIEEKEDVSDTKNTFQSNIENQIKTNDEAENKNSKITKRIDMSSKVLSSSTLTILMFFMLLASALGNVNYSITAFDHSPGAMFIRGEQIASTIGKWNVVARMSMNDYNSGFNLLQRGVDQMDDLCIKLHATNTSSCATLVEDARRRMNVIIEKDMIIRSNMDRAFKEKRGAWAKAATAFLWSAIGSVVGSYASEAAESIGGNSNEDRLNNLEGMIQSQTSIMNLTESTLEKTQAALYREINEFANKTAELQNEEGAFNRINDESYWLALQLLFTLTGFENLQNTIIENTRAARNGLSLVWISPERLQGHLMLINQHLPEDIVLYGKTIEENLEAAYKLSTTHMFLSEPEIIIIFEIPLFRREKFNNYEIIIVPIAMGQERMISLDSGYSSLWVAEETHRYVLSTAREMTSCKRYNQELICDGDKPTNLDNTTCEFGLFSQRNESEGKFIKNCKFTESHGTEFYKRIKNGWIFTANDVKGTMRCGTQNQHIRLNGSGIIRLHNDCAFISTTTELRAHDDPLISGIELQYHHGQINTNATAFTFNVTMGSHHENEFGKLREAITNLHHSYNHYHHIHHYAVQYGLIFVVVIITYWLYRKLKLSIHNEVAQDARGENN